MFRFPLREYICVLTPSSWRRRISKIELTTASAAKLRVPELCRRGCRELNFRDTATPRRGSKHAYVFSQRKAKHRGATAICGFSFSVVARYGLRGSPNSPAEHQYPTLAAPRCWGMPSGSHGPAEAAHSAPVRIRMAKRPNPST